MWQEEEEVDHCFRSMHTAISYSCGTLCQAHRHAKMDKYAYIQQYNVCVEPYLTLHPYRARRKREETREGERIRIT